MVWSVVHDPENPVSQVTLVVEPLATYVNRVVGK